MCIMKIRRVYPSPGTKSYGQNTCFITRVRQSDQKSPFTWPGIVPRKSSFHVFLKVDLGLIHGRQNMSSYCKKVQKFNVEGIINVLRDMPR